SSCMSPIGTLPDHACPFFRTPARLADSTAGCAHIGASIPACSERSDDYIRTGATCLCTRRNPWIPPEGMQRPLDERFHQLDCADDSTKRLTFGACLDDELLKGMAGPTPLPTALALSTMKPITSELGTRLFLGRPNQGVLGDGRTRDTRL